jgi:hypothetical protein
MIGALLASTALASAQMSALAMSPGAVTWPGDLVEPLRYSRGGFFSHCLEAVRALGYAAWNGTVGDTCSAATRRTTSARGRRPPSHDAVACPAGSSRIVATYFGWAR